MTKTMENAALITGASRGMGRATALALAQAGNYIIVHYGKGADEANDVVMKIRDMGGMADAVGVDLAAPDGPALLAAKVKALVGGKLDILVANAGIGSSAKIEDQTIEKFDGLYAVNVRAPYFVVQQLLPLFHEDSSIVLLSSLGMRTAVGDLSAYSATKGAVDTLVKYFAAALGPRGIRVNAVAPGVIATDMSSFAKTDDGRAFILGMQALKRIGQPEDVADVIAFLASKAARWITGTTIAVDGGSRL
jgi:3-oxoacyl-[acyl-carrier protein] reductase